MIEKDKMIDTLTAKITMAISILEQGQTAPDNLLIKEALRVLRDRLPEDGKCDSELPNRRLEDL